MTLGDLIARLKEADPSRVVPHGFHKPHSYRGFYDELAFKPKDNITVADMLSAAEFALNQTFDGYKGGEFTMNEYTPVWLADYGDRGEQLGARLLEYMLTEGAPDG